MARVSVWRGRGQLSVASPRGFGEPLSCSGRDGGQARTPLGKLTVGDVDASRNAGAGEGENVQGGEVGGEELVLLEGWGPGQLLQQLLRTCHQPLKLGTHGLVHHGHEACGGESGL